MAGKGRLPTHKFVTKADLTEAVDRIAEIFAVRLTETQSQLDTKFTEKLSLLDTRFTEAQSQWDTRFTEMQSQWDTKLTEIRLQLERKMDWVRQDSKEQLESVETRLTHRIDRVEEGLQSTQTAVLHLSHDMKEVKATLADHGQKLDRLGEKVTRHEHDIAALKESRMVS